MTIESKSTPSTINMLSPLGFKFLILEKPNVSYYCQTASIPGITLGYATEDTMFARLYHHGDLDFQELNITFKVDEDLANYKEIWNWMVGLGFPHDFNQYKNLQNSNQNIRPKIGDRELTASLLIYSGKMNVHHEVTFESIFPTSLSDLQFTSMDSDVNYIPCTATFRYTLYTIRTFQLPTPLI